MNSLTQKHINETVTFLKAHFGDPPGVAVILGSGLGALTQNLQERQSCSYKDIPHFIASEVSGHSGKLTLVNINNKQTSPSPNLSIRAAFLEGRSHYYEGYTMKEIAYPVYALKGWGVKTLIITNAAGGINRDFKPGDLMLITDHINLMGANPLIGPVEKNPLGPRFQDLSEPYSHRLLKMARETALGLGIQHCEGVYAAWTGPTYETAAEIRFLGIIGADAVGMSTVPEAIAANHAGIETLAISCITNMATGISSKQHEHEEILKTAKLASERFCLWLEKIILTMET